VLVFGVAGPEWASVDVVTLWNDFQTAQQAIVALEARLAAANIP
jgi:hypothetical protein